MFISSGISCPQEIGEDTVCFDIRVSELSEDFQDSRLPKQAFPRIVILEPLSGTLWIVWNQNLHHNFQCTSWTNMQKQKKQD